MAKVLFSYGVKSAFDALSLKDQNTLYFITDKQMLYKGETLIADKTNLNVAFVTSTPTAETAAEGILYVVTVDGKTTLQTKINGAVVQVGGGEATQIADGIITISKFAEGVVATDFNNPNDTSIPTTKAVSDAITSAVAEVKGAFVDVSVSKPVDGTSGTVLTFRSADDTTKEVTVADIFLSAAQYDSVTHKLKLTLNDENSTQVEVDLSDLVGNSLSDVKVGDDEAFTVELGNGGSLGGYKTGDLISKDTSIETIVKKLLMKQVPPTYTQPSVSISNNSGTASGNYEIGTTVTPNLRATFTKNDAGSLTEIQFFKNDAEVGDASSTSPATYTETGYQLVSTVKYKATASYAEGTVKNDNLGDPYPTGHIAAGSKTTSVYTFTPYRQGYFIGTTTDTAELSSATVRGMTKKNGAYSVQTVDFTVPAGAKRVVIACPATNTGMTKVINKTALNADVTSTFVQSTLDIEGAEGYSAVSYKVWTFVPSVAYANSATLSITFG